MVTDLSAREAMDDYVLSLKGAREPNTVIYHRSALRQLVNWMEERGLSLQEFRGRHFDHYLGFRREGGASDTTRYHDSCCARKWLEYCRREGYVTENPLHSRKFKKPPHRMEYVPTDAEIHALLKATLERRRTAYNPNARFNCQTDRTYFERWDHAMILGYIETGCRLSEMCKLLLCDVDSANKTLTFRDTKTDQDRQIPVSDKWLEAVKRYLTVRPKQAESDTLFVTTTGRSVKPSWMCDRIRGYAVYAGIPLVTAQAIRRWRLTKLAHENILIASLIGGNSVGVIRRHYLRPDIDAMRKTMESTLSGAESKRGGRGKKLV